MDEDYLEVNRRNWDSRVPIHIKGYALEEFRKDPNYLSAVVRFDLPYLPKISGLKGIHLQSHIGTDTISLIRLGAKMTALDFSVPALEAAKGLANELGHELSTIESDVYSAPDVTNEKFDFVYTGVGAICWLPDITKWAAVVEKLLVPGGFLFIREGHPMLWTLEKSRPNGDIAIDLNYFAGAGFEMIEEDTYAGEGKVEHSKNISFNHALSEIFNALWDVGLQIELFKEHQTVPFNLLGEEFEQVGELGEWQLRQNPSRLAASYTLIARKPNK
ncbi:MAG: class I SAM-dependent methyltransferase [Actinomycetota bacterium]